jgi:metal-responsive CopG/Arc/MetJ family transcriptional regulator
MSKAKLSVTVDSRLVEELDELAQDSSRSRVVEQALTSWLRERRRRRLEHEIERYYADMAPAEQAENAEWAELSAESLDRSWS